MILSSMNICVNPSVYEYVCMYAYLFRVSPCLYAGMYVCMSGCYKEGYSQWRIYSQFHGEGKGAPSFESGKLKGDQ